jgi:signal transduction histidine kinase
MERRLWPVFGVCIFLSSITGFLAMRQIRHPSVPREHTFDSRTLSGWTAYGGTWTTANGAISVDSIERGAKLVTGRSSWQNYSIEADLALLADGGDIGLTVRSTNEGRGVDSYRGYYAGLRAQDSYLIIGHADYGWAEYANVPLSRALRPFHWYHLKIVAVGCTITAKFTDPETGETRFVSLKEEGSNCLASGRIGLRSVAAAGRWRNIRIAPATPADLQPIVMSDAPPPHASKPATLQAILDEFMPIAVSTQFESTLAASGTIEPISHLRQASTLGDDPVEVRGKVILTNPALFVQDSTGGTMVPNVDTKIFNIGDQVLVQGKANPSQFSSSIIDAKVTNLGREVADPPFSLTVLQAATGAFDARFVELQGHLSSVVEQTPDRFQLDLYENGQRFRAILESGNARVLVRTLKKDSLLDVRGVCMADLRYTGAVVPFALLLRSSADVKVVNGPPWWNARNLIAGSVSAVILSLLGYLSFIRAEQWRLRAVIEERQRLAHDLHDTLAQSFAGVGFQLRAIRKKLPNTLSALCDDIDIASELVQQGHQEARQSISTFRINPTETVALLPALLQAAQRMVSDNSIELKISSTGDPRHIPLKLIDVLFRVGQEAIANAIRHSSATQILIRLAYLEYSLHLTIEDNGVGFVPDECFSIGFGLRGMQVRVETIGGIVHIVSVPGRGTQVRTEVPLARLRPLQHLFIRFMKCLQQ